MKLTHQQVDKEVSQIIEEQEKVQGPVETATGREYLQKLKEIKDKRQAGEA